MKTCNRCGVQKPLDDFRKAAKMVSGYLNQCKECVKLKARQDYAANKAHYDAYNKLRHQSPGYRAYIKQLRQRSPEKYKAYDKQYRQSPDRKAYLKQYYQSPEWKAFDKLRRQSPDYKAAKLKRTAVYYAKSPLKYKAHMAVKNAVKNGKLERLPCLYCGAPETEAHHPDYSKPLDVQWLCRTCHMKQHEKQAGATQ